MPSSLDVRSTSLAGAAWADGSDDPAAAAVGSEDGEAVGVGVVDGRAALVRFAPAPALLDGCGVAEPCPFRAPVDALGGASLRRPEEGVEPLVAGGAGRGVLVAGGFELGRGVGRVLGRAVGLGVGLGAGVAAAGPTGAGPGAVRPPLCQRKPMKPPAGTLSDPTPTLA